MMIFFNLQNWNIHSEGQYIIVCFINFNVSNGHQHHATIDTSCTPPSMFSSSRTFPCKIRGCDIIMMIFFNLQNWNIHSEGQYIIVCFIKFNVSNGHQHQHHATIDTSCTPPPSMFSSSRIFPCKIRR